MTPHRCFQLFAEVVHNKVPRNYTIDLHAEIPRERGICGEHGRVVATRQGVCPRCAGTLHDAHEIDRLAHVAKELIRLGLYDPKAVDAARNAKRNANTKPLSRPS